MVSFQVWSLLCCALILSVSASAEDDESLQEPQSNSLPDLFIHDKYHKPIVYKPKPHISKPYLHKPHIPLHHISIPIPVPDLSSLAYLFKPHYKPHHHEEHVEYGPHHTHEYEYKKPHGCHCPPPPPCHHEEHTTTRKPHTSTTTKKPVTHHTTEKNQYHEVTSKKPSSHHSAGRPETSHQHSGSGSSNLRDQPLSTLIRQVFWPFNPYQQLQAESTRRNVPSYKKSEKESASEDVQENIETAKTEE